MTATYERTWETRRRGARSAGDEARESYYGVPVIHKPHWKWSIVLYFFIGGIAGASYTIATVASLVGGRDGRQITRVGRYLSFAALLPSPALLIYDLGRPERFHHMLRILKIRSPMSVGTWTLTLFGIFSTLSMLIQAAEDGLLGRDSGLARMLRTMPARLTGLIGAVPAFFVSGYTGVLLSATAVPLWAKNYLLMGPLFLASALTNAAAAMTLILSLGRNSSEQALRRLESLDRLGALTELALLLVMERTSGPTIARPITSGHLGRVHRYGVLGGGLVLPLWLHTLAGLTGRHSRAFTALVSLLTLIGGFLFRYVIVFAGKQSADDPQATFEFTKANGRGEGA